MVHALPWIFTVLFLILGVAAPFAGMEMAPRRELLDRTVYLSLLAGSSLCSLFAHRNFRGLVLLLVAALNLLIVGIELVNRGHPVFWLVVFLASPLGPYLVLTFISWGLADRLRDFLMNS